MKKLRLVLAFIAIGAVVNFSSCSKDDSTASPTPTPTPTPVSNGALIDGASATSTETPAMSDKTAVLKTTAGTFEMEFASKPTESGVYTVKSSLAAKDASAAAKAAATTLKVVTFKFTSKDNLIYKAADNAGGTVSIIIKDGKISIDVSNITLCYMDKCKKISVKYDFSYTPPVINPGSTSDAGTGYIDGVKSVSTFGTGMVVGKSVVINTPAGSFQVWFKDKPMVGTFKVRAYTDVLIGNVAADEAGLALLLQGNVLYNSKAATGTIVVTESGNDLIVEAKNISACTLSAVSTSTDCKTVSAFYKVPKPQ